MTVTVPTHNPVLLQEVLQWLPLPASGRMLDLTLGLGGHAEAFLGRADGETRYLAVDRDPEARRLARERLSDPRLSILAGTYESIWEDPDFQAWMQHHAREGLDSILADLGVSSLQFDDPSRGFSFRQEGPLDMRMDPHSGLTAAQWLAAQSEAQLADALYQFGEERASRPIARSILRALSQGRMSTTRHLAEAVYQILPKRPGKPGMDPATRTFQGIRIAVNQELVGLTSMLEKAVLALRPGGRLGVISFHSLEDRIVKQTFRRLAGHYDGPGRMPPTPLARIVHLPIPSGIVPTPDEIALNPRSRSARLRVAERLAFQM